MELSEAKEILKEWLEYNKKDKNVLREADTIIEIQETILKALDNSISKEYHDMAIKEQNDIINDLKAKLDNSISKDEVEDIYPLTIIKDRYGGAYSGGEYTAWNLDFEDIPAQINDEDVICHGFWVDNEIPVGKGETPIEAVHNLQELLGK